MTARLVKPITTAFRRCWYIQPSDRLATRCLSPHTFHPILATVETLRNNWLVYIDTQGQLVAATIDDDEDSSTTQRSKQAQARVIRGRRLHLKLLEEVHGQCSVVSKPSFLVRACDMLLGPVLPSSVQVGVLLASYHEVKCTIIKNILTCALQQVIGANRCGPCCCGRIFPPLAELR